MDNVETIFRKLFEAKTEKELDDYIENQPGIFKNENWKPIGGTESNFSIIENQQSNPIAALVEKVTNSIDAILMKKCIEAGIDPKGEESPKSMDAAIEMFFGAEAKNWDLKTFRRSQSEEIQILADGPTKESAVVIYDNGEGQHPEMFESTFLSLMKGNKNEIQFVQGKYNMGGDSGRFYQLTVLDADVQPAYPFYSLREGERAAPGFVADRDCRY